MTQVNSFCEKQWLNEEELLHCTGSAQHQFKVLHVLQNLLILPVLDCSRSAH